MDTKGGKRRGEEGGSVINWAIGIDMYTMMCIKLLTKKDLLYKKVNKIKLKRKKNKSFTDSKSQVYSCSSVLG